ncbi:MAG: M42 family metallopeptidase [Candidatus Thorarchaeota archaeon]
MTNQLVDDLRELSQIVGVSSREGRVAKAIQNKIDSLADESKFDALGNLIVTLKGTNKNAPTLMLDAHMDEIGIMVSHITAEGFLYFQKIGGFIDVIFAGQTVVLVPENEAHPPVYGVIGIQPPHITSEEDRKNVPKAEDLAIDIGAVSEEDVKNLGIDIGTTGTLVGEFRELPNNRVLGKAFDDCTGCVVLIEVLRRLSKNRPEGTIVFNFATAEEVGGRGAATAAFSIEPDMAIALENTTAADTPGVPAHKCPTKLESGPAITVADHSLIVEQKIIDKFKVLAAKMKIPWQYKKPLSGGTDAGRIVVSRSGVPSAVLSVPCRYIHSPISILSIKDLERTCDLVEAFTKHFQELL